MQIRITKGIVSWFAVIVYSTLIFIVSSIPGTDISPDVGKYDKALHMLEYIILSALIFQALMRSAKSISIGTISIFSTLFASVFGLTDEIHQYFVPLRYCDPIDFIFDCLGALVGPVLTYITIKRYAREKRT